MSSPAGPPGASAPQAIPSNSGSESARAFTRRALTLLVPTALNHSTMEMLTPIMAALMARTAQPEAAIGGYAVALGIVAFLNLPRLRIEALTLVFLDDRASLARLRRFVAAFALLVTAVTALVAFTPAAGLLLERVFAVEAAVQSEAARAMIAFVPFAPLALVRTHLYGAALRMGSARIVWAGTVLGVASAGAIGLALLLAPTVDGALVGALALTLSAALEVAFLAGVTRAPLSRRLPAQPSLRAPAGYGVMLRFFAPLLFAASLPAFTVPFLNASIARGAEPTLSIAAFAIAMGVFHLVTVTTNGVQSLALALFARGDPPRRVVALSLAIGLGTLVPLGVIAFVPPVTGFVLGTLLGATGRLLDLATLGLQLLVVLPPLLVLEQAFAAALMRRRNTRPIVYINLWRLAALFAFVLIVLRIQGVPGIVVGAGAVTFTLTLEALLTLAYGRRSYRALAADYARPTATAPAS